MQWSAKILCFLMLSGSLAHSAAQQLIHSCYETRMQEALKKAINAGDMQRITQLVLPCDLGGSGWMTPVVPGVSLEPTDVVVFNKDKQLTIKDILFLIKYIPTIRFSYSTVSSFLREDEDVDRRFLKILSSHLYLTDLYEKKRNIIYEVEAINDGYITRDLSEESGKQELALVRSIEEYESAQASCGHIVLSHGCPYSLGNARRAYVMLYNLLAVSTDKYPEWFCAFRFPAKQDLKESLDWSEAMAQELLGERKHGQCDNARYIFCQMLVMQSFAKDSSASSYHYFKTNDSASARSFTLKTVCAGLVDQQTIDQFSTELDQVDELYTKTNSKAFEQFDMSAAIDFSSMYNSKGLLYLISVDIPFVQSCMAYRQTNQLQKELSGRSFEYLVDEKYAQVEHLIPARYLTDVKTVQNHVKAVRVIGFDESTPEWHAYDAKLKDVLSRMAQAYKARQAARVSAGALVGSAPGVAEQDDGVEESKSDGL